MTNSKNESSKQNRGAMLMGSALILAPIIYVLSAPFVVVWWMKMGFEITTLEIIYKPIGAYFRSDYPGTDYLEQYFIAVYEMMGLPV